MPRHKWDPKTKANVVLRGLKGKPVADICTEHQISQSQYYQWREQFMKKISGLFSSAASSLWYGRTVVSRRSSGNSPWSQKNKRMVRMKRQKSASVTERNSPVVARIKEIKSDHPFWGYRRIWAHLKYINVLKVNKKRILRLMQKHELLMKPNTRLKAIRTPSRSKPRPTRPYEWWGTNMTKVMVESFGWMYIVVVLDWYTKKIVGHYAGVQCRSKHWLEALDDAVNCGFPNGVKNQGLSLMSDNGSQPTSIAFIKSCREMGIKQAFTSL